MAIKDNKDSVNLIILDRADCVIKNRLMFGDRREVFEFSCSKSLVKHLEKIHFFNVSSNEVE